MHKSRVRRSLKAHQLALSIIAMLFFQMRCGAQTTNKTSRTEQSRFAIEIEAVPVQQPIKLSKGALQALSKDQSVYSCLKSEELSPEELPAAWFYASEIHLDGPEQIDLIVLPGNGPSDTPPGKVRGGACLLGANTGGFWVLHKTGGTFEVVLSEWAQSLDVLITRSHGLRDIRVRCSSLNGIYIREWRFDGKLYRLFRKYSRSNP